MTNEEKGRQGELYVSSCIYNAACKIGAKVDVFNNIFLKFPSLYGCNGMMTTELDHVILLLNKVVIIETKTDNYEDVTDYNARTWKLQNGEKTDNPIYQNRLHKEVLCSLLNLRREDVYTVECLLNYANPPMRTQFPNDYVIGYENIVEKLSLIFYEKLVPNGYESIREIISYDLFWFKEASEHIRPYHKKNLKNYEEAAEWVRTHEGEYKFRITDVAYCPFCHRQLIFKKNKWVDNQRGNIRRSKQFMIGCVGYRGKDDPQRHGCYYYNPQKGKGFDRVKIVRLSERMGWDGLEKHVSTLLDGCENPKERLEQLQQYLNINPRKY